LSNNLLLSNHYSNMKADAYIAHKTFPLAFSI
jgi:hypothetical protein